MTIFGKPVIVIRLSVLCHDPALAEIFRRCEGDDLAPAEYDRPVPPRHDGTVAQRILEEV